LDGPTNAVLERLRPKTEKPSNPGQRIVVREQNHV
jgi:hypothetical protein